MSNVNTDLWFNITFENQFQKNNIPKEEIQEYFSAYSKQSCRWLSFTISVFSMFVFLLIISSLNLLYFYSLVILPSTSKGQITEAFTSTTTRTVGLTGISSKLDFLSFLSIQYKISFSEVSSNFTESNFVEAFKSQVVYVNLELLNNNELNALCNVLKNSKSTFFGGCVNEEMIQSLKSCKTPLEKIFYTEQIVIPFGPSISAIILIFVSTFLLLLSLASLFSLRKLYMKVSEVSRDVFEPKGMKIKLKFLPYFHLHLEETNQQLNDVQGEDVIYDHFQDE
jgi:hypothetical protein